MDGTTDGGLLTAELTLAGLSMAGLCGWWQVSQGRPEEWSAEATCGKVFGLAAFAS